MILVIRAESRKSSDLWWGSAAKRTETGDVAAPKVNKISITLGNNAAPTEKICCPGSNSLVWILV
jgi:hypothetical protein